MRRKQLIGTLAGVSLLLLSGAAILKISDRSGKSDAGGEALVAVNVPQLTGAALQGQDLFQKNCVACHGENASGRNGSGPPLVHKIYEPGHHADGSFFQAVARGVRAHHWPFGNMPPVENVTGREVEKIVAYVRTLQRANGIY
ncbi:c-type cytochrome [Roseibium aggregatum]|uniref:Cytochrome c n=1 Tax=Roseibium aggregatum TaxID=187304 RepID=A0A939E9P0_9HYPH|nr:cytochrome c [Roseibium aggregatum]MBN9668736.1 cytochrome c [Roseibium aggregatum]